MNARVDGRILAGVATTSLSVLVLELALTRLFSATMYYHFAFLAISLALFGSGASGVCLYVLTGRFRAETIGRWLSPAALLFSLTTLVALAVVLGTPLSPVDPAAATARKLLVIYCATALPFFFAGGAITLAITRGTAEIGRLYSFDLAGAAAGCLLLIPIMNAAGAVNTVLLVSCLGAVAALMFSGRQMAAAPTSVAYRRLVIAVGIALTALLGWNAATGAIDVRRAKGLDERGHVIFAKWNSFSRVTVWGNLDAASILIMIDADAATVIRRNAADTTLHEDLRYRLEALPHYVASAGHALILGPGGGDDVVLARAFGSRQVTAVEVNPIIARDIMSSEPFRSYSGALYEQPDVRLFVDEGRSFIRGSRERYELIQATLVDTWAATAAGAFALTENNLYTVEAFKDYITHLSDDGVLAMTRWYQEPPDQVLRLVGLARAAMRELGIGNPGRHLLVLRGPLEEGRRRAPAAFIFKKSELHDREVRLVEAVAARNGFEVLFTPLTQPDSELTRLVLAEDPARVWGSLESNVEPPRDNSPFFFHSIRLRNLGQAFTGGDEGRKTNLGTFVLFALLVITTLLVAAFIFGPLLIVRRRLGSAPGGQTLAYLLYFACLGTGFILIEVALVQKWVLFLGHPVYALAVVLFSVLVFSALGSHLSGRFAETRLRGQLAAVLAACALLVALYVVALPPLIYGLVHLARPLRIALSVVLLAPLGTLLGMPMPVGIRLLAREVPEIIPWAWGVNGGASVVGSVAAVAIGLLAGFNQALLAGAGLYLLALLLLRRGAARAGAGVATAV